MNSQKVGPSQNSKMPRRVHMPAKPRIYYAHPVTHYGREFESVDIAQLESMGFDVVNPNSAEFQKLYVENGMHVFMGAIYACQWVAVRPFTDGSIGAGVAKEYDWGRGAGMPCILLAPIRRVLTIEETRDRIKKGVV